MDEQDERMDRIEAKIRILADGLEDLEAKFTALKPTKKK